MHNFDPTNNISWQLGHRGLVAVFIDGNNLFHAARFHNIDIDYNKLLRVLLGDGRLLRAFFYTGVDVGAERQQGFLLWMRRNGFPVPRNPILKPLENIECRDAILNLDGTETEWPAADAIIGNPPFLGAKLMKGRLVDRV